MNAFRCLRVVARPSTSASTLLRPRIAPPQSLSTPSSTRQISLLTPRRPILPRTNVLPPAGSTSLVPSSSETLDLASKISSHPGLGSMQIRCGPRDTYNPSHLVRKRRHGFLSRIRTKKGRKMIMRRLKKGRWNISH
ncbi:ribosomal protein L34-domain-containing protein [Alternaria rosae]|uniref:ribosomal protein L34-domain-containing protein n=1 Tax=Alternaria rosae TaxID=1187941 RepID=UPI001E8D6986|nr:ribosomal protein L34-domain-containing protein [Alternaria rosae]KAH6866955.1 ribosomal protein L34-domain-containing protein [Alternaria rosae]